MRHFNSWLGLGPALERASKDHNVALMPDFLAQCAEWLAEDYAKNSLINFEARMEHWIAVGDPTLSDAEMHAAKSVIGSIFAANRELAKEAHAREHRRQAEVDRRFAATQYPLRVLSN